MSSVLYWGKTFKVVHCSHCILPWGETDSSTHTFILTLKKLPLNTLKNHPSDIHLWNIFIFLSFFFAFGLTSKWYFSSLRCIQKRYRILFPRSPSYHWWRWQIWMSCLRRLSIFLMHQSWHLEQEWLHQLLRWCKNTEYRDDNLPQMKVECIESLITPVFLFHLFC